VITRDSNRFWKRCPERLKRRLKRIACRPFRRCIPRESSGCVVSTRRWKCFVEQDPHVQLPAEALFDLDEQFVPGFAIQVVDDDRPLLDPAADDVVPRGARELRAGDPRHPVEASAARRSAKPSSRDVS
jgi:hypothetical protein